MAGFREDARPKDVGKTLFLWLTIVPCTLYLFACTSLDLVVAPVVVEQPDFSFRNDALFDPRPGLPSDQDIHRLTPAQVTNFFDYFNDIEHQPIPPHKRVYAYLEEITAEFSYHNKTYTAAQTLELSQGNCLSLAILTTALARLANVDIGYQLADAQPVFEHNESIVLKGVHVRTLVYGLQRDTESNKIWLFRPRLTIDYFPSNSDRFMTRISEALRVVSRSQRLVSSGRFSRGRVFVQESHHHCTLSPRSACWPGKDLLSIRQVELC